MGPQRSGQRGPWVPASLQGFRICLLGSLENSTWGRCGGWGGEKGLCGEKCWAWQRRQLPKHSSPDPPAGIRRRQTWTSQNRCSSHQKSSRGKGVNCPLPMLPPGGPYLWGGRGTQSGSRRGPAPPQTATSEAHSAAQPPPSPPAAAPPQWSLRAPFFPREGTMTHGTLSWPPGSAAPHPEERKDPHPHTARQEAPKEQHSQQPSLALGPETSNPVAQYLLPGNCQTVELSQGVTLVWLPDTPLCNACFCILTSILERG